MSSLKLFMVQQFIKSDWNIYTVRATNKAGAKKAAIAKGADPKKRMSVQSA